MERSLTHSLLVCSCVFPICLIVFIHGVPSGPSDKIGTIQSSHPWQEKCLQTTVHRFISDAICKNIWVRIWVQLSRTVYESWKVKILIKIYNGKRGSYFHFINPSIRSKSNHRQRECGTLMEEEACYSHNILYNNMHNMLKWHCIFGQGMRCHFTLFQTLITIKWLQQKCNSYQRRIYYDTWKKAKDFTGTELAKESPGCISKQESARSSFYLPKK